MNNLKILRLESGLTRAEIASRAGLKPSQYSKLESGERPLRQEYIQALAKVYNVKVSDIIEPRRQTYVIGSVRDLGVIRWSLPAGTFRRLLSGESLDASIQQDCAEAPSPPEASDKTVALIVRTNSMGLYAPEEAVIYFEAETHPVDEFLGKVVVVHLPAVDGQEVESRIARVFRGREYGKYDLVSPENKVESNIPLTGVSRITWIKPET